MIRRRDIKFRKTWFNPLYFIIEKAVADKRIRTILIYGGKSSAKTVSICQVLAKEAAVNKFSSLTFRKESTRIETTIKRSLHVAVDTTYLYPLCEKMDREMRFDNGAQILMQGLDSDEKVKGVESFKYVFLDELNHYDISEYEQLQMSLRGMQNQKIFAAWNPVDERSWVKTDLTDTITWTDTDEYGTLPSPDSFIRISGDGRTLLIKTDYRDNFWIVGSPCGKYGAVNESLIAEYESMRTRNFNQYRINVLGEYGKTTYGGEFLKQWKSEIHAGTYPYNPDLAVYLMFDENTVPYFPCGVFQVEEKDGGFDVYKIAEFALKNPDNTTHAMGRAIARKLLEWGHNGRVFIGGDATSVKDDVKQEKGHDLFKLMAIELKQFRPTIQVARSNPSVVTSAFFLNSILENEIQKIRFRVDLSCKTAISDYENTKEDKNGKVDKKTVTDPRTKQSYQPFGHFCDLTRYFFCTVLREQYRKFEKSEDRRPVQLGRRESNHGY
jgi:phage terminase large subunit